MLMRRMPVSDGWLANQNAMRKRRAVIAPTLEFIPEVTPQYQKPLHLAHYAHIWDLAPTEGLRTVVAAPPQHGKTVITLHGLIRILIKHPRKRNIYATYAQWRADNVQREARRIAIRAGLKAKFTNRVWYLPEGGSIIWTSICGQITGEPVDGVFVIDDAYRDRKHALSAAYRRDVTDAIDDVIETRVHRGGSIIDMGTRWTTTDLAAFLIGRNWPYVNYKALCDGHDLPPGDERAIGEALWDERKTRFDLLKIRDENAYSFESLYQGRPRPRDAVRFGPANEYSRLPAVYQLGYGLDLAYSEKTSSDYSVLVSLAREVRSEEFVNEDGEHCMVPRRYYYVLRVDRMQVKSPEFARLILDRQRRRRATAYFYASGIERGSADLMIDKGCDVHVMPADADKYIRSEFCADAWNAGRILVPNADVWPEAKKWLPKFLEELEKFTGKNDAEDDQVDALVSGYDGMQQFVPVHDSGHQFESIETDFQC